MIRLKDIADPHRMKGDHLRIGKTTNLPEGAVFGDQRRGLGVERGSEGGEDREEGPPGEFRDCVVDTSVHGANPD